MFVIMELLGFMLKIYSLLISFYCECERYDRFTCAVAHILMERVEKFQSCTNRHLHLTYAVFNPTNFTETIKSYKNVQAYGK